MPANVTYPGVYVLEESSGAQAVAAVSTSTALFVGMASQGPFETPTRVLSLVQYERVFGATSPGELADQVRQFYVNGGGEAWIMRVAQGANAASILLREETFATDVMRITARDKGAAGNLIRVEVDHETASPDRTFNLTFYRHSLKSDGTFEKKDVETYADLSMDPQSARYASVIVNGASALVVLSNLALPAVPDGVSIGGVIYNTAAGGRPVVLASFNPGPGSFRIAIGNNPPVDVTVPPGATATTIEQAIEDAIVARYAVELITVQADVALTAVAGGFALQIKSTTGPVVISAAANNDVTAALGLGIAAGGVELDGSSPFRPAPTGLNSLLGPAAGVPDTAWLGAATKFAAAARSTFVDFTLTDPGNSGGSHTANFTGITGIAANPVFMDDGAPAAGAIGSLANVRRMLDEIGATIGANSGNRWTVKRVGLRLSLQPKFGGANAGVDSVLTTTTHQVEATAGAHSGIFVISAQGRDASNVGAYSLGRTGGATPSGKQTNVDLPAPGDVGTNGSEPLLTDYQNAFNEIDSELDSFNLMILPRAEGQDDAERKNLWGIASALAAKKRAILLVDPDSTWTSVTQADLGLAALKVGVETRNAAIYWPRLVVPDATIPAGRTVDPSGSIAGLMARTDTRFGVWTAPAGIEATIRGIIGISKNMSDDENGVLNPKALNAIRQFPSGVVAWGARTMIGSNDTGNIDDKYIPVRRTMLFIEESLYRGLKFAVFRPNAEPLWASIRLAAGSFMNSLMRQGAFASRNKLEAYYVLCDATTTTATDINLGIVNVVVAFAPLKPAEFVVLTVKQIAGQVEI
jgi:phage tail sheath protein FI